MSKLWDISYIRQIMGKHGVHFSKGLGQNFLIDPSVCPQMAALSLADSNCGVLEIGPGLGVLTYELSQVAQKVVAVELDQSLFPVLAETLADCDNVKIVPGDILKLDLKSLISQEFAGMELVVCANLPYYITSLVVMRLLEERLPLRAITVMVQKEAAERLCALPGTRACGAVSAAVRYYSEPEILFSVGRDSFLPAPKVDSAVIRLTVLDSPPVKPKEEAQFFRVIKAAFGQRRKTIPNAVSSGLGIEKSLVRAALAVAELPETARAEALSLSELCRLANALCTQSQKEGDRT